LSAPDSYDVVIAGSGLGGLLSAVLLAKEGMKVCVLEKDKQIGGCLQTFSVQKKVFDSCVHYIGGLGEGHTLNKIFRHAGIMDKLSLQAYDPNAFDKIAFADEDTLYPQAQGSENFIEQLLPYFPNEKTALKSYIDKLHFAGDHFPLYKLREGIAEEKQAVADWPLMGTLQDITTNKRLQQVLAGNNLLYAGTEVNTPFYLHALVVASYIHSSHKVLPGSSQIAKFLWQQLQQYGGVIHRETELTKLIEENGTITYAETKDGQRFYGKYFIANMHPALVMDMVDSKLLRPVYRNRVKDTKQTISSFMLNLVLKPATVPMRHYNIYWHATEDVWAAVNYTPGSWPANYALFFTEDPKHPGYAETVSALSYMHYSETEQWQNTQNRTGDENDRGESYEQFKSQHSEKLLEKLYQRLPELRGNITAQSAATPLTYRDYTSTPEGALYGVVKGSNSLSTRTRIPNLYLTGQNLNLHGVLGVSITAIATCAEFTGIGYLLNKINKA
jgi:all-trans-retinol 13,14-reductase